MIRVVLVVLVNLIKTRYSCSPLYFLQILKRYVVIMFNSILNSFEHSFELIEHKIKTSFNNILVQAVLII